MVAFHLKFNGIIIIISAYVILSTMANKPSSQPSDIRTVFQPHRNKIFLLEPIVEVFNPFTIMALSPKDLKKKNKIK